jgi:AcrR family transcriptional regulator
MSMDKRTVLMLTAKRLFAVNGFYGTPTALIAKEAGVSNGILFHYFPTKEALIKAMYFDLKDRLFVYSTSQVYKGATLKESIYNLWLAAVEWNLENPDDFDFMQQFENSPYYSLELEKSHRYVQMSLELAQKGIDEGIFKQVPASLLFQTMSGLVETAVRYLRLFKETQEDTEFKNRLFEMAWDAISKNKI